jgi:glycerophosphoryl diester phosphodiesterase
MKKIIAHRGYWLEQSEKNTAVAFGRALEHGFGIETDFRDLNGQLVVSHDMPDDSAMKIEEFIDLLKKNPVSAPIALNIKADGLYSLVKDLIIKSSMPNYFVFDMSVPDTRGYIAQQIPVFTRLSEYETSPAFFEQSRGIWLDAFESEWYDSTIIKKLLDSGKEVAIVSPELHRRHHLKLWRLLKDNNFHENDLVSLCTDFPQEAKEYFNA